MRDLQDLALYELENTAVDFKAVQYQREKHSDLLKDIIALANADVDGDRFIVLGIKLHADGTRELLGVEREEFRDPAEYQQLIAQNIEPDLGVDYLPVEIENVLIGVLRIHGCLDPPYLMRKQYLSLQAGDGWVRKGTHQTKLTRKDYERFGSQSETRKGLRQHVRLSFLPEVLVNETVVSSCGNIAIPSALAAEKIKAILAERRRLGPIGSVMGLYGIHSIGNLLGGPVPYEQRDTETLEANLEKVGDTYAEHDLHHVFEKCTHHLQLYIYNGGNAYIEDASIHLYVPILDGLEVVTKIYREPPTPRGPLNLHMPNFEFDISSQYPLVEKTEKVNHVRAHVGDVRHGLWAPVFDKELRLLFGRQLEGKTVGLSYSLFAKNLPTPAEGDLTIKVTMP